MVGIDRMRKKTEQERTKRKSCHFRTAQSQNGGGEQRTGSEGLD
jgi:hypothetical protein